MKERILTGVETLNEIWNDIFLNSIYVGKIYVKGNKFHMVVNGTDNIINAKQFKAAFQVTFDKVYKETIYPVFNLNSFSSEQAETICIWLDPTLEDLGINGYDEYIQRLEDKFTKARKNYNPVTTNLFRIQLRNTLIDIDPERRKRLISYIKPYQILNLKDLVDLEYYTDLPRPLELQEFKDENGEFSETTKQALAELSVRKLVELKNFKHKVSNSKIKNYTQYISPEYLINMAEWNQIPYEYLSSSDVTKKDIFSVKYEMLISALDNMEKYPSKLRITSQDILNEYGVTVSGSRFYKLAMYGYVDSKDVIDVVSKNKILRLSGEPEENLFDDEEVLAFYSSDRLTNMLLNDNIDSEFVKKYKMALNDDELFNRKSRTVIEKTKFRIMTNEEIDDKDETAQKLLVKAYRIGLCSPEILKENINQGYIEELYLSGEISDTNILNLYRYKVVDADTVRKYFSEKEIFDFYLQGDLDKDIISVLENIEERNENILEAVMDGKMPLYDVASLYITGTLDINILEDAIEFSNEEFNFETVIDENTDFSKIKEMFERKIIDYSCVTNLKENGIITENQLKELKKTMDKDKFFDDLKGKTFKLVTDRKAKERVPRQKDSSLKGYKPKKDENEKYKKEKELISKILGLDNINESVDEYASIESYNNAGRPTSLNGYKIFGSKDNGLVIFSKFQKENAVFIMPFYQAAYFLNSRGQENSKDVVIEDRMKDKAYLKTLNQVEVIMHTEYFARNLSSAACKLSPEFEEKYTEDCSYKKEVTDLCAEMRRIYRIEKGLEER